MDDLMKCDGLLDLFSDLVFLVDKRNPDKDKLGSRSTGRPPVFCKIHPLHQIITALQEGAVKIQRKHQF